MRGGREGVWVEVTCVQGTRLSICDGNCALLTRNELIPSSCSLAAIPPHAHQRPSFYHAHQRPSFNMHISDRHSTMHPEIGVSQVVKKVSNIGSGCAR